MNYATGNGSNADYNNQQAVPNFAEYFDRWRKASEQVRTTRSCIMDVPYGNGWRQTMDIFPADASEPAPVFVFIHGGWWYFLDKKDHSFVADPFCERNCTVVMVGYPLAPAVTISQIVESVRQSILWVRDNIGRFGGDPSRIHIAGHSAGGHLTTMMAATDWTKYGATADLIKSACPVSGLFDLTDLLDAPQNRNIRMSSDVAAQNSPIRLIPEKAPPLIICVGKAETAGFLRQHEKFMKAWSAPTRPTLDASIEGENHFSIIEHLGRSSSPLFKSFILNVTS